jgi:hypothetical protein
VSGSVSVEALATGPAISEDDPLDDVLDSTLVK